MAKAHPPIGRNQVFALSLGSKQLTSIKASLWKGGWAKWRAPGTLRQIVGPRGAPLLLPGRRTITGKFEKKQSNRKQKLQPNGPSDGTLPGVLFS